MTNEKSPIDLDIMNRFNPTSHPLWEWGGACVAMGIIKTSPGTRVDFYNLEALPSRPVILAMNHTQFYDFLPLRVPLLFKGHRCVSWVKARAYRNTYASKFLMRTGNIPICSKGYIVASDFFALFERPPTNEEYEALRVHLKDNAPFPEDNAIFARLQYATRDILGRPFDPKQETWREAIRETFYDFMQITLEKTRRCVERGDHVHVYPQGTIAPRLVSGKTGIIQTALALNLPILAVGVSGCREAYIGSTPFMKGGSHFTVRFADNPYIVPRDEFPPNYRPFHLDDELAHRDKLQHHVNRVMDQLNELVEPHYQWADEATLAELKRGVDRFF